MSESHLSISVNNLLPLSIISGFRNVCEKAPEGIEQALVIRVSALGGRKDNKEKACAT
jgi:hypothetical protein